MVAISSNLFMIILIELIIRQLKKIATLTSILIWKESAKVFDHLSY